MNKIYVFIIILWCLGTQLFAQKIVRSSLSSFGNVVNDNGTVFRQTIGQPSSTSVFSNDNTSLRQGFQQPVISSRSLSSKEKECTLYLSPNPASTIVNVKFGEEIGENKISVFDVMGKLYFTVNIISSNYEMDISKMPKGVYLINVVSKSGYHCNQKLVVI